jgi:xanthine dehydrogenase accessory factor
LFKYIAHSLNLPAIDCENTAARFTMPLCSDENPSGLLYLFYHRQMKNIYLQITEPEQQSQGLVLATVTASRGSTPQKPGCSALFVQNSLIAGTVGGGIVESKIQEYAGNCSSTKESAYLHFSMDSDIEMKEEAVCGGTISILVDADPHGSLPVFQDMRKSLASGKPGVLLTRVTAWGDPHVLIMRYWVNIETDLPLPDHFKGIIMQEVSNLLSSPAGAVYKELDLPVPGEKQTAKFFLEPVMPLPWLVIAGAGHIGRALSHLGRLLDFEVTVIDDRKEYANHVNLPDADHIVVKDIGEAMKEEKKDNNTYIAIVTRGHSHDADALRPCIGSAAAYVGMMGSKKKVAKMHEEFIKNRWATEEQWQAIYTPIGIEIGSKTIEEIAVSIAAQLVQTRQKTQGKK